MVEIIKEDIITYWKFIGHKKQTEIRAITPRWFEGKKIPISIYISNENELVNEIEKLNGKYNIYIGINERKENGKEDSDVPYITNIGHDIDAHDGSEEKLQIAYEIALKIKNSFIDKGFKEPLILNSGRGYWVIHHIKPIENTEDNIKKIKEFSKRINEDFKRDGIELDSTVYNPSRIARVPGTLNVSEKDKFVLSKIINYPFCEEDEKLTEAILKIEPIKYISNPLATQTPSICSFMDYCLTHEIPKGERHKVISRNMAIYISDHPDRELLKEQYIKIQKGNPGELDNWLKGIDENGKEAYPFGIGEMVNFTRKYKIPFDWTQTPEYKQWTKLKKAENNLNEEIEKETKAEKFGKAIKFFMDKKHLAEQFIKIQPLYYDIAKLWWIWNFELKCWELCDETDILNNISNNSEADTISSSEKNEILEALKQVSRKNKPKDMPTSWIQFKNGIIDLETFTLENYELIEPTPEYFCTNPIQTELGDSVDTPTIEKIFIQWVGEKYSETLFEIIAYCMYRDYPIHRLFCFMGSGMNGKSCYFKLMEKFIGLKNCSTTELDTLMISRFEITKLHKKLVCQMGETDFNEISKTSILKKLTGNDLIGLEYKNKNPFEDRNYAKILIATNNLPPTSDKTIGFYRRWTIIDFPNQFNEDKDILKDIPEEEYKNLALKCVFLLKTLLKNKKFTNEGNIEDRKKNFEDKSNPLDKFIKEETVEDYDGYIFKFEFEKRLNEWCRENKFREMGEVAIGKKMKEKNIVQEQKKSEWYSGDNPKYVRAWVGMKWREQVEK